MKLSELDKYSETVYKELQNDTNVFLEVNEDNGCWIDYILDHPNESFRIRINKNNKVLFFQVRTKEVRKNDNEKNIIVVLNEIS